MLPPPTAGPIANSSLHRKLEATSQNPLQKFLATTTISPLASTLNLFSILAGYPHLS